MLDIVGNPSGGYGIDATGADCPEMNDFEGVSPCDQYSNQTGKTLLNIDNTAPTIAYSYSNQTTGDAVPNLAKAEIKFKVLQLGMSHL